jgi:transcription antitermination factor NusG
MLPHKEFGEVMSALCPPKDEGAWYAVTTRSRSEKKVTALLAGKAIETFLPLQRRKRQWCDRLAWVDVPLLPSYVFVRPTSSQRKEVLFTPGVVAYVQFSRRLAIIHQSEIEFLRRSISPGVDAELAKSVQFLNQKVEIIDGPFAGYAGILFKAVNGDRVAVQIGELQQSVVITISPGQLRVR